MSWRHLLFALLLLTAPGLAMADLGSASKIIGSILIFVPGWQGVGYGLLVAGTIYGNIETRRKMRQQRRQAAREFNDGLQARTTSALTAEPPYRCNYGRCTVGGDVLAVFTTDKVGTREDGSSYTKPDGLQHVVMHFQSRQAQAIHEIYIDNVPVGALDGSGVPTGGAFSTTTAVARYVAFTGTVTIPEPALEILAAEKPAASGIAAEAVTVTISGGGLVLTGPVGVAIRCTYTIAQTVATVRVSKFLGSPSQAADAYLQSVVPAKWTADHRLRGLAGVVVTLDLEDQRFQGGLPNITADGSWALLYDWRKDSTVPGGSGAHRANDPSTWEWNDTTALCVGDFLASEMGYGVSLVDDISAPHVIAAANACDVAISLDDGAGAYTGKRYTCNGAFTSEQNREDVLQQLLDSMAGSAVPAGQWVINAGAWTPPIITLEDADLAGSIEIVQADTDTDDLINSARGRFIGLGKSQPEDADPPYSNAALVAADQGQKLWGSYSFPFTNSNARVRNLLRINVERKRNGLTIQYPAKLKAWGLPVGERVYVNSRTYAWTAKAFRITDRRNTHQAPVLFTLQEDAAEIWDQADAGGADATPNTGLADPYTVAPLTGLAAASGTANLVRTGDGSIVARVVVSWDAITDSYVVPRGRVLVRWRRVSDLSWRDLPPVPGDATETSFIGVTEGESIVIEATPRNTLGQLGPSRFKGHTVVGKAAPPSDVAGYTVAAIPGGVQITWTPNLELDYKETELRVGASWAAGTTIFVGRAGGYVWPWPAAGSYTVYARHRDSSGNLSSATASASITVGVNTLIGVPQVVPNVATDVYEVLATYADLAFGSSPGPMIYTGLSFTSPFNAKVVVTANFDASVASAFDNARWAAIFIAPMSDVSVGTESDYSDAGLTGSYTLGDSALLGSARTKCSVTTTFNVTGGVAYLAGLAVRNAVSSTAGPVFYGKPRVNVQVIKL